MNNILFFTRTMGMGGTEKVILQLCKAIHPYFDNIIVCSCGGVNESTLEELQIRHYRIPDIENKDPKTIFVVLKTVSSIIKREKISVIHTHHRMAAFYTRIISLFTNFIFIHTAHNTFSDKKWLTQFALKKSKIIAVGEVVEANIHQMYGIDKNQITVIYNSIEVDSNETNPIDKIQQARLNGCFIIGNIGRLSKQKGMEYFIKAVPLILCKYENAKFFIIGDGEDRKKLNQIVTDLKLNNDVFFLGYRSDVINVLRQLDLLVLSSLWEGFPLTPIEAFSVEKTIVATDVDGTKEIVEDGVNGLLIEPKDSNALANAVCWLMEHATERQKMQKSAYITYQKRFNIERFENAYVDFYKHHCINRI